MPNGTPEPEILKKIAEKVANNFSEDSTEDIVELKALVEQQFTDEKKMFTDDELINYLFAKSHNKTKELVLLEQTFDGFMKIFKTIKAENNAESAIDCFINIIKDKLPQEVNGTLIPLRKTLKLATTSSDYSAHEKEKRQKINAILKSAFKIIPSLEKEDRDFLLNFIIKLELINEDCKKNTSNCGKVVASSSTNSDFQQDLSDITEDNLFVTIDLNDPDNNTNATEHKKNSTFMDSLATNFDKIKQYERSTDQLTGSFIDPLTKIIDKRLAIDSSYQEKSSKLFELIAEFEFESNKYQFMKILAAANARRITWMSLLVPYTYTYDKLKEVLANDENLSACVDEYENSITVTPFKII